MTRPGALVKPPQRRAANGVSTIHLEPGRAWGTGSGHVFVKRQQAYWCRPLWRLGRRTPMLRRELRGLEACRRLDIRVPRVVAYREQGGESVLALEEVCGARRMDQALADPAADRGAILGRIAETVGRLHRAGWAHGALYPPHILVGPGPDYAVTLIDFEKARHNPLRRRSDLARFWRYCPRLGARERAQFMARYRAARQGRVGPTGAC